MQEFYFSTHRHRSEMPRYYIHWHIQKKLPWHLRYKRRYIAKPMLTMIWFKPLWLNIRFSNTPWGLISHAFLQKIHLHGDVVQCYGHACICSVCVDIRVIMCVAEDSSDSYKYNSSKLSHCYHGRKETYLCEEYDALCIDVLVMCHLCVQVPYNSVISEKG